MGGNAFPKLQTVRIKREDIDATLHLVAKAVAPVGITYDYLKNNLMGSTGKKADSGDIDIAVDKDQFDIRDINQAVTAFLGQRFVQSKTMKGGQIQTAFPIAGDPTKGYIQVDFIAGKPEWLKFSHWSPGDKSQYPGVYISTALGVLAKMLKDYETHNPETGERTSRVGLAFNLEKGVTRQWKRQKRAGQGVSKVSADDWETNVKLEPGQKLPPRFTRLDYVDDPEAVVNIFFPGMKPSQIETFEELYAAIQSHPQWEGRVKEFEERFVFSINRSSAIQKSVTGEKKLIGIPDIFND